MQYFIDYTDIAIKDAKRLAKNEPAAFKKLASLIEELKNIHIQAQGIRTN